LRWDNVAELVALYRGPVSESFTDIKPDDILSFSFLLLRPTHGRYTHCRTWSHSVTHEYSVHSSGGWSAHSVSTERDIYNALAPYNVLLAEKRKQAREPTVVEFCCLTRNVPRPSQKPSSSTDEPHDRTGSSVKARPSPTVGGIEPDSWNLYDYSVSFL
jgi:hypothetical protein